MDAHDRPAVPVGPAQPRDAATVVVLRERDSRAEVLMLRRHARSGFAADAWVFPGGTVDEADCLLDPVLWMGIDPQALAPRFRRTSDMVLGMHVAAVRETFEEAGLLLARHADGRPVDLDDPAVHEMRKLLADRDTRGRFNDWLAEQRLVLDLGALTYWSRWVTPRAEPRRYDTCFFLAHAPEGQVADHDRIETTGQSWIRPADALAASRRGELFLIYPTIRNLEEMAAVGGGDGPRIDDLVAHAGRRREVRTILPHVDVDDSGRYTAIHHPDEPGFPHHLYPDTA